MGMQHVLSRDPAAKGDVSSAGIRVSFLKYGSGPPLVLVHGAFSDHLTDWELIRPLLKTRFTVHAIARRGRGETDATDGHSLEDEIRDAAAVIRSIEDPVFLLGHSYGAHVALGAAAEVPDRVRKLVLYEPAWPHLLRKEKMAELEALAEASDWDGFAFKFFQDVLTVPPAELDELRASPVWTPIIMNARATLGDLRARARYDFRAERFRTLRMPVLLQVGSESPRHIYVTDSLAAVLPDARIEELPGQAHDAMTTAPEQYAEAVTRFLLS